MAYIIEKAIYSDESWAVELCPDIPVPGYLILRPSQTTASLRDLSPEQMAALGPILAKMVSVIEDVVRPEKVYVCLFDESGSGIHFHLFPRHGWMKDFNQMSLDGEIDGPLLLSQILRFYRHSDPDQKLKKTVIDVAEGIALEIRDRRLSSKPGNLA